MAARLVSAAGIALSAAVVLLAGAGPSKPEVKDRFLAQLDYLRRQPAREVGRDALVAAYQRLIAEHEKKPRVAEAMMDVAALMELKSPPENLNPDEAAALKWYRRAAQTATPGSPLWTKANFYLAGRLIYDTAEPRQILQRITEHAAGHSLTLARVEHDLQAICLREDDLAGAEVHCRRILDWYNDPARVPKEDMEKFELDRVIASAGGVMIGAWATAPWPKSERKRRMDALVDAYGFNGSLHEDRRFALELLAKVPDLPETVVFDKVADSRAGWRWALTIAGLVLLVVLGYLVYRRPWRRVA